MPAMASAAGLTAELRWIGSQLVIELSGTRVAGYNTDDLKTRHRVDHLGMFLVNKLST